MSDFKTALLRLGDDAFFELVRNYLGPIKTPFNKHDLISRLERFLRRDDIRERIFALIDDADAELLSAIWLLEEPHFDEVYLFFAGQRSYLDLHRSLLNLEDRLLIYRAGEYLRINPILLDLLQERVLSAERLFASRPRAKSDPQPSAPWVTDTLLISVYAYARERPELFRADRSIRKRAATDLAARLTVLTEPLPSGMDAPRAGALVDALIRAGALAEEPAVCPVRERWVHLAELSPVQRLATLVAASASDGAAGTVSLAQAIEALFTALPRERVMSAVSVERLLVVLASEQSSDACRRAREAMTLFGMLVPVDTESVLLAEPPVEHSQSKPLVVQPNFDVTMPEEFDFSDGLFVAGIARLTRHDRYPHYELAKDRLAGALREGSEIESTIERLRELAGGALPQNVVVTMRSWAREHESVRLFKGVVLQVEEARRHAVEHSEEVQSLIHKELAPGIYLIDERDVDSLQRGLENAGIELVPEISAPQMRRRPEPSLRNRELSFYPARLESFARIFAGDGPPGSEGAGQPTDEARRSQQSDAWLQEVRSRLEDPSLSSEQREELASRIKHKLVLSADQIQAGALKSEKTEARGLDYVGKVRLIENAIRSSTSFLEVIERTEDGAPRRRLIEPTEMGKRGNDLLLIGEELPSRTPVELQVRKLGLVRRIRAGLVKRRPQERSDQQ